MQDRLKNTANEVVMALLFASLLVIFLIVPPSNLVTFLCVITLAISLIVAITSDWNDLSILGLFAGLVSLVAAYFVGRSLRFGAIGGVLIPLLWLGVLALIFTRVVRGVMRVPKEHAVLIRNRNTYGIFVAQSPLVIPVLERIVAIIPLYQLSTDVEVKKINTFGGYDVNQIDVRTRFKVADRADAPRVLESYTNRDQAQTKLADEIGKDVDRVRIDLTFWEKLLAEVMHEAVEDVVRAVIFESKQSPVVAFGGREQLRLEALERLNERMNTWGIQVLVLEFIRFEVESERFKLANRERTRSIEEIDAEHYAKLEADRIKRMLTSEVEAEALRVRAIIDALRQSGVEITADIVIKAIHAASDRTLDGDYQLPPTTAPISLPPPPPRPDKR